MPGIVGLITKLPREKAVEQLERMTDTLRHESFYNAGTWANEESGVYVGWVACKDSFSDGMPIRNEREDVILVFSGEEFPEPGTPQRLQAQGHELDPSGPQYLVHLYEEDPSFPAGLNGRFHGLVIDRARGRAMLFNDRYGMHRIYCHKSNDAFYFAAEAKAILAVRPELRSVDQQSLGEFVACGAVLENRTLFQGIHLLPPASSWQFRNGSLERKESYFNPRVWEDQEALDTESYYKELREVFARNLPRYFNGRQRVAMSLTGGLDTRMIMAWRKPSPGSLPCYTFGGELRDCQDVIVARRVAALCDQAYKVVRVGQEFRSRFPHYAERAVYLAEGSVDVSRSLDLYLNEQAREIAPVRMTGNYGGEILRRVRTFKPEEPLPGLFCPEFFCFIRQARATYVNHLQERPLSFALFTQAPWHFCALLALDETQVSLRAPFFDNDFVRTVFRAPESAFASSGLSIRLIADGNHDLLGVPTDRGLAGERNAFWKGVSHAFLEFLFKAEYAYDIGMPQWLASLDHILSPLRLERLFLGRHKIFHFRVSYRDALAGYLREMLLDPRSLSRPYIEKRRLEAILQRHLRGDRNYTAEIHKLLTLELFHRLFVDQQVICKKPSGCAQGTTVLV